MNVGLKKLSKSDTVISFGCTVKNLLRVVLLIGGFLPQHESIAETLSSSNSGAGIEAVWTDCPAYPIEATFCHYTTVFAARGNNFQPFLDSVVIR